MMHDGKGAAEPWERLLRKGLDGLSAPVEEESPPDLGALIMLVEDVQRAQRQALMRDLLRFVAVAALVLFGGLWAMLQFPLYYLIVQAALAVVLAAGAAVGRFEGRRIFHE